MGRCHARRILPGLYAHAVKGGLALGPIDVFISAMLARFRVFKADLNFDSASTAVGAFCWAAFR